MNLVPSTMIADQIKRRGANVVATHDLASDLHASIVQHSEGYYFVAIHTHEKIEFIPCKAHTIAIAEHFLMCEGIEAILKLRGIRLTGI